ncbi:MAG: hypothetical protein COC01_03045 [Bacteroidetes bacterium]|nr:response regulator [Bacteroidia bacterium]PCH68728.1 MAG: hypothetical protein COC01_03045 [Bacteroidota bacterium]
MISSSHAYKIFLVDDDDEYLEVLNQHLNKTINQQGGYFNEFKLQTFPSADECIAKLSLNPDFIILDFYLPGLNGLEALLEIKKVNPEINVIILSGNDDPEMMEKAFKSGAYDYIVKGDHAIPYIKKDINNLLKKAELVRSNVELSNKIKKQKKMFVIFILIIFVVVMLAKIQI